MNLQLGINLGFATNKYAEPEEWTRIVGQVLGLRHVQFVADLLDPFLPKSYIDSQIGRIQAAVSQYDLVIDSIFTSSFTRVNHLMHPDPEARRIWLKWLGDLLKIGANLGARTAGSHFGILTFASYKNELQRKFLIGEAVKAWQELTFLAQELGYENLIFEPMSVPREMANTVEETMDLLQRVNENCGVPMRICLDIGHAPHPEQRDPYRWIEQLGALSPIIHLQQTVLNKSNHWPFISEYNEQGIIQPAKVLEALVRANTQEALLLFEISHREHWDTDFRIIEDLKASVDYWRPYVPE